MNFWFGLSKWVFVDDVGSRVAAGHGLVFDSTLLNPLIQGLVFIICSGECFGVSSKKNNEIFGISGLLFTLRRARYWGIETL